MLHLWSHLLLVSYMKCTLYIYMLVNVNGNGMKY